MRQRSLAVTIVVLLLAAGAAFAADPPAFRLPAGARPTHYALSLTVVPGEPKASGEIAIDVELDRPHEVLWLNADDVSVKRASVDTRSTRVEVRAGSSSSSGFRSNRRCPSGVIA